MNPWWQDIAFLCLAYLIGSIPSGLVSAYIYGLKDPRELGSGSIGSTNLWRAGGAYSGLTTFAMDLLKGILAVYLAHLYNPDFMQIAGLLAVIGQIFPIWLSFKGGKGVATSLGVLLAWDPFLGVCLLIIWGGILFISNYVSLSSLVAAGLAPIVAFFSTGENLVLSTLFLCLLLVISHRDNIKRLVAGNESKIGSKKKDQ